MPAADVANGETPETPETPEVPETSDVADEPAATDEA